MKENGMSEVVGGLVTVALGVIVVAAIFQLGKPGNPTVGDVTTLGKSTLSSLYK